jgi:hypothetical protein
MQAHRSRAHSKGASRTAHRTASCWSVLPAVLSLRLAHDRYVCSGLLVRLLQMQGRAMQACTTKACMTHLLLLWGREQKPGGSHEENMQGHAGRALSKGETECSMVTPAALEQSRPHVCGAHGCRMVRRTFLLHGHLTSRVLHPLLVPEECCLIGCCRLA